MAKPRSDWSRWSEPQLRALCQLDRVVPLHETAMKWAKVRGPTTRSLIDAGLVVRIGLVPEDELFRWGMPFLVLTREGEAVKRDYVLWARDFIERVGSSPLMAEIAEVRL